MPQPSDALAQVPHRQVSVLLLKALFDVVRKLGVSPEALLGQGDALDAERAEQSYSLDWFRALFARAARLTEEPALGLLCGLKASESSFGLMAPLVSHAPSLRQGLALIAQFQALLLQCAQVRLSERAGVAELRVAVGGEAGGDRSLAELIVAGLARTLWAFGCTQADIRCVCFEHARPAYYPAYTAAFGGVVRFATDFTGIEFSAQALDRPHLHRQPELHSLVLGQAERQLERLSRRRSYTERVQAFMTDRRALAVPDMAHAARELGLSVRSLRRHLDDEGTSYRALTQSALERSACSMLRNPALTLQAVAYELGFSNPTAFHRAFRRWTKRTPAEYRGAFH